MPKHFTVIPRTSVGAVLAAQPRRKRRRCSPAERTRRAEAMRQAWREGRFADRPKPKRQRPDQWTAAHDLRLRALVGQVPVTEIAARLSTEFPGTPRTETAVIVRLKRLGLSPVVVHYNARAIGKLFGVDGKTVTSSWIPRGWLQATQQHPGVAGSSWVITAPAVEAFVRDFPWVYDWEQMRPGRWRSLAEVVWRRDPLLPINDAARIAGVHPETLRRHARRGWLTAVRRRRRGGARQGEWLVARSALTRLALRRPGVERARERASR